MKAIIANQTGGVEVLECQETPITKPGKQQVLVKIHYAGVNFIDIYFRTGLYPSAQFPIRFGKEGSGEIVEVGTEVTNWKVGDRVAFPFGGSGTYAEYSTLNTSEITKIPDTIDYDVATASMLQGLTAHYLCYSTFPVKTDQIVLIHSGAGGVGLLLTQMCRNLGARVITTVSNLTKKEKSLNAGADKVIVYEDYHFEEEFLDYTNGQKASVVFDSVAKETFEQSLRCLQTRGMLVLYGNSSGVVPPFQLNRLNALGSLYVTRPVLAHYIADPDEFRMRTDFLWQEIGNKNLEIEIGNVYPLEEATKAHSDLEQRKTTGKSILKVI